MKPSGACALSFIQSWLYVLHSDRLFKSGSYCSVRGDAKWTAAEFGHVTETFGEY